MTEPDPEEKSSDPRYSVSILPKMKAATPHTASARGFLSLVIHFITKRMGDPDEMLLSPAITKAHSLQTASGLGVLG